MTLSASRTDALKGSEYVLLVVKDINSENLLSSENLLYIDQKAAEGSTVTFDFVLPSGTTGYTAKIFGVSHGSANHNYGEWKQIKTPTCTESGTSQRTCTICDQSETKTLDPTGHSFDGTRCKTCGFDRASSCSCKCHKSGLTKFIFKITNFFQKLFGKNKVCACGKKH